MAVILRIFRARVKPGMHAHFARLCRETSMPWVMAQPGIIYFHIGKPMPQRPDEFVLGVLRRQELEILRQTGKGRVSFKATPCAPAAAGKWRQPQQVDRRRHVPGFHAGYQALEPADQRHR